MEKSSDFMFFSDGTVLVKGATQYVSGDSPEKLKDLKQCYSSGHQLKPVTIWMV